MFHTWSIWDLYQQMTVMFVVLFGRHMSFCSGKIGKCRSWNCNLRSWNCNLRKWRFEPKNGSLGNWLETGWGLSSICSGVSWIIMTSDIMLRWVVVLEKETTALGFESLGWQYIWPSQKCLTKRLVFILLKAQNKCRHMIRDILKQKLILSNKNQYFFSCPGLVFIH